MQIELFKKKETESLVPVKRTKNDVSVTLGGLKLLELLSICSVDEFNLYQWVFIYDCTVASDC
jgi:hypothetical protein